jgi:hypothetical protein
MIVSSHLAGDETMTADTLVKERDALIERCIPFLEEAKDGGVITLFFLPSGRISYHEAPQE